MVNRQTLTASTETDFEFDSESKEFVVKNLTNGYILVCFESFDDDNNYKIPANTAQVFTGWSKKLVIKSEKDGEVEVDA